MDWQSGRQEVRDETSRQLLKQFYDFTCHQMAEEADVEAECLQLEMELCGLWYEAMAADTSVSRGRLSIIEPERELVSLPPNASPGGDTEALTHEEWEDEWLADSTRYPYHGGWPAQCLLYGEPSGYGDFHPVAETPGLFRIVSEEGVCSFYNDSPSYVMHIKLCFPPTPDVAPGPTTTTTTLEDGQVLYEVQLAPQDTVLFSFGLAAHYANLTQRVLRDHKPNPHFAADRQRCEKELENMHSVCGESPTEEEVLAACLNGQLPAFIDPAFPPRTTSIYRAEWEAGEMREVPWYRPSGYLPDRQWEGLQLFRGDARPTDTCKGEGGSGFCEAASALSLDPKSLRNLFRHPVRGHEGKEERRFHAQWVSLHHHGWWRSCLVDDYLPASHNGPTFGRCERDLHKLWYPLLEKAHAKMNGSYAAVQSFSALSSMQALTGYPTWDFSDRWRAARQYGGQQAEQLFHCIDSLLKGNHWVCCYGPREAGATEPGSTKSSSGTKGGSNNSSALQQQWVGEDMGLPLVPSCLISGAAHDGEFWLIQIRHSSFSTIRYDGRWCRESILWKQEPQLAAQCHNQLEAAVWVSLEDVVEMFLGAGVILRSAESSTHDYRMRGEFSAACSPSSVLVLKTPAAPATGATATVAAAAAAEKKPQRLIFSLTVLPHSEGDTRSSPIRARGGADGFALTVYRLSEDTAELKPYLLSSPNLTEPFELQKKQQKQSLKMTYIKSSTVGLQFSVEPASTYVFVPSAETLRHGARGYTISAILPASVALSELKVAELQDAEEAVRALDAIPAGSLQPHSTECQRRTEGLIVSDVVTSLLDLP